MKPATDELTIRCDTCRAKTVVTVPVAPTRCKTCGAEGGILHHDPTNEDVRRTLCGACQGNANRIILDRQNGSSRRNEDEEYGRGRRQ